MIRINDKVTASSSALMETTRVAILMEESFIITVIKEVAMRVELPLLRVVLMKGSTTFGPKVFECFEDI